MAGSTAVASLVLALEARNNTAAAFAELRGQLREQVEAARTAAHQTEEAARQAGARQLLDLRQRTAQELLELRQKTAFEAQQIRQSAAGKGTPARQAADNQILMRRQDAAQEDLLMRQSAEKQAQAIRETTAAQVQASRAQLEAVERTARLEAEAMRASQAAQAQAAREAAASERASAAGVGVRSGPGGPVGIAVGAGQRGVGLLESMGRFGAQMALWNVGSAAVNRMTMAVGGFAAGLVTANSYMEQVHQTFSALYQSDAAATSATNYLTQFALDAPDTRVHVMAAGETIASLGLNIKEVMTPLGNVAAVMGKDMPTAAQAFADAYEGRFQMLQTSLHITKGQLIEFGMQVDANGHVLNDSFVPAFERLAKAKFGDGMTKQMDTVAGVWSNVADAVNNLQRILGKPMFGLIRKDLADFMNLLLSPGAQIAAHALGVGLGNAFHAMSNAVRAAAPVVWGTINLIVGAWNAAQPVIQGAIKVIGGAMSGLGIVLQRVVLPAMYYALGQIAVWWADNATKVAAVIAAIKGILSGFGSAAGSWMGATLTQLRGIWEVGWGALSGVVSLVLDVITGNWSTFGGDLGHMTTQIALGVSNILKGLVENAIIILYRLKDPINAVLHGAYGFSRALAGMIFDVWNNLPELIMQSVNSVLKALPAVGTMLAKWAGDLGKMLREAITGHHPKAGGGGSSGFGAGMAPVLQTVAQDKRTARQRFVDTFSIGLPPDQQLTFGKTPQQAIADVEAWWTHNVQDPIARTDTPGMQASARTAPDFTTLGKETFQGWLHALTKAGGLLDMGKHMPQWLKDLAGGLDNWSGGGGGKPFDFRSAKGAQHDAIEAAQTRFQIDLAHGTITQPQGMKDISAILAAMKAAGATKDQRTLTLLQDTKTLDEQLLQQAQKTFDFDAGVAHPSRTKLHQDELAYLGILAQTPGITPVDLKLARQQMDAHIKQIMGGKVPRAPVGPVARYGGLAGETGYGQVTVSFGGAHATPLQQVVAELRAQLTEMRKRAERDENVIALLEGLNNTGGTQLGVLRSIDQTIGHPPPVHPARSAHSALKAAGSYAPVVR